MALTVGDFVAQRLDNGGVQRIYGYEFVQVRHEERVAFAACAHVKYGRVANAMTERTVTGVILPSCARSSAPRRTRQSPLGMARVTCIRPANCTSTPQTRPLLQLVNEPRQDAEIPGGDQSFGTVIAAQDAADVPALRALGLPAERVSPRRRRRVGADRTDVRPAELVVPAWRPREAAYRVVGRQLDACGKDRAVPGTEHGFSAGLPGPLMPLGPAGPPVSAPMPPRADGPQQAQRGQPERRVPTEVLIFAAVQRGGEETRLRRGRVALGSPGAAAALAAPHHRLPIAREAVPVAEDFATQHRDSD
jgi:hypothetical protein